MIPNSTFRSTITNATLSAGVAFSGTVISEPAFAQQDSGNLPTVRVSPPPSVRKAAPKRQAPRRAAPPVAQPQTAPDDGAPGTIGAAVLAPDAYNAHSAWSPKQTGPLLDTPQTVTVIPQQIIRERDARDLTEILRNTPGITFDAGENGFGTSMSSFKLRGFNTSGDVFVDDSRDNGSYPRDSFNIERVEVFKGPAADNGRGSAGGYINIVTKSPVRENFIAGDLGIGFDEYNSIMRKRATVDFKYMLNENWTFRLNGVVEQSGVPGREIAEARPRGIAPSLAYGLGTNFRAIFAYEHQSRHDIPDWGVPAATIPGMLRFDPVAATAPRDAFYGLRSDFDHVTSDAFRARFEYDVSDRATLSNQTRWSRVERTSRFTTLAGTPFTTTPLPATAATLVNTQTLFYDRVVDTLTNLTNFSAEVYTGPFKHNLSVGLDLSREESDANRQPAVSTPVLGYATSLFDPNPDRRPGPPLNPTQTNGVKVNSVAAYAYDTMHLSRHWQLIGGLRAEHYNVDITSRTRVGAPIGNFDNFETSETTLGGKFGVVYKPVQNGSFYAAVGVSHLPPGAYLSNSDISREGDDAFPNLIPGADPVRSINYEVGTKWDFFNGRLSATAAVFHTDKRVPITGCIPAGVVPPSTCAPGQPIELKGYGHHIAQGIELSVAGNITEHWKVFGGLLLMRTERQHSAELDRYRMAAQPGDYPVGFRSGTNGDELAFTPNISANLWTTYRLPYGFTIGGGLQYVGESYAGRPDDAARIIPNGVFGELPSYFLVHLMAAYEVRKGVDVRFNIDNITDRKYAVSSNWAAQRVMLGAPRTFRVSASFKF